MKHSAGLLVYRYRQGRPEVFLVHPGGPFWTNRDDASWSIPKGECEENEDSLAAALREFREETGLEPPTGKPVELTPVRQSSRKVVHAWYLRGELQASAVESTTFEMEWPPRSGRMQQFPEVDRAAWFDLPQAKIKLHPGQVPIVEQLEAMLQRAGGAADGRQRG